jgi:hypothetical protein
MREILPGVFHWTARHPRIGIEVSSYWLETGPGGVLLDPLVPPDLGIEWFAGRAVMPAAIILSNRHHYRQSGLFAARFGCPVRCVSAGLHEFTRGEPVEPFEFGDELPGALTAIEIDAICPDDTALYSRSGRWLAFADGVVRGGPHGRPDALGFVPDELMDDPPATRRGLLEAVKRALAELEFEHVLLAHGDPLIDTGRAALEELVSAGGRTAFEL